MTDGKELDASRIVHSLGRSGPRGEIHLLLIESFPDGISADEISEKTKHRKETIMGALVGKKGRYKREDALVQTGMATMREEEHRGRKIAIFTASSDGKDVDKLLRNYSQHKDIPEKVRTYLEKLDKDLEKSIQSAALPFRAPSP